MATISPISNTGVEYNVHNATLPPRVIIIQVRPEFFIFAEVAAILCVVFGVIGNVLTVATILHTKKIRDNSNNIFVLNMSISDMLFCGIVLPFTALQYHMQYWPLHNEICEWVAFFKFAFTCMSLVSLCLIASNRYVYLIHPHLQSRIFSQRNVLIYIIVGWFASIFLTALPIMNIWGEYSFDDAVKTCTFSRNHAMYRKFIVVLSLFVPFAFMIICYSCICFRVYTVKKQMQRWTSTQSNKKSSSSNIAKRENLQLTTTMILIFLLHGVSCLPYTCVGIFDPDVKSPVFHIVTPPIAWLQFVLNPLVYTIANQQFRKAYKMLILKAMCMETKYTIAMEKSRNNYVERSNTNSNIHNNDVIRNNVVKNNVLRTKSNDFLQLDSVNNGNDTNKHIPAFSKVTTFKMIDDNSEVIENKMSDNSFLDRPGQNNNETVML